MTKTAYLMKRHLRRDRFNAGLIRQRDGFNAVQFKWFNLFRTVLSAF